MFFGNVQVYAYGGAGSNTVPSLNKGTNSGGSGYPAAGIGGRWCRSAVVATGAAELVGYVGTWGDDGDNHRGKGNNGLSLSRTNSSDVHAGDDAASYFSFGTIQPDAPADYSNKPKFLPCIGGQGGLSFSNFGTSWPMGYFASGCGGRAGEGGIITVENPANVYAFNGDRITDNNYTEPICDYDKDGKKLDSTSPVITQEKTNKQVCPLKIFAQGGILRNVYYSNLSWGTKPTTGWKYFYDLFDGELETSVQSVKHPLAFEEFDNVLIRKEQSIPKTGYTNPMTQDCYGIGSGAGYMEVSNGTFSTVNE